MVQTEHILIVEDSTTQAEYLRRILEGEGYRVTIAVDGESALKRIAEETPDLVLSDIVMPGMGGYELCEKIKESGNIPVFLVTQLFDPEDVVHGVASGADNFIIKPFDSTFILDRLKDFFETRNKGRHDDDLTIQIAGHSYHINADRETILNILLSTYALAVQKNIDLSEARDELFSLNEQLHEKNDALKIEIMERERVERALSEAHRKLSLVTSITRHGLLNQLGAIHESLEYAARVLEEKPDAAKESILSGITGLGRAIQTTRFTQEYQKIGENPPVWQKAGTLVPSGGEYPIEIAAAIPSELSIYIDPFAAEAIRAIITDCIRRRAESVQITCEERKAGYSIILEDDGIGIPAPAKEALFSHEQSPGRGFSLFLAREALAITGIELKETGDPRQGGRFEIHCPAGVFQIGSR